MKPRRRPHPATPVKIKDAARRINRVASTRSAIRTGESVARAVGPLAEPRRRKPPRKNARSTRTT